MTDAKNQALVSATIGSRYTDSQASWYVHRTLHFHGKIIGHLKKKNVNTTKEESSLAISFIGIYPREMKAYDYTKIYLQLFSGALLVKTPI